MSVVAGILLWLAATSAAVPPTGGSAGAASADTSSSSPLSEAALRTYTQARLLELQGNYREAIAEYYRAMVLDHRSVHIAQHVAELASRLGDFENALESIDRALSLEPADPRSLWIRGSILFSMGRAQDALADLRASAARDSSDAERLRTLGRVAEFLDEIGEVEHAYSRVVELDPEDGESWFQLAAAQARLGRFHAADSSLKQVVELSPMRPGQIFLQAWVAESLGRRDEAITLYRHHLEMHPADLAARRRLVNTLSSARRWKEALAEAHHLALAAPEDFEARMVEIEISFRAGRSGDALRLARRLADVHSENVGRTGAVAALLARNKRGADAIRIADDWRAKHVGDVEGLLLASRIRALAGQTKEAIPIALSAIEAQPDSLEPRTLLARLYFDQKRYPDAVSAYREAARRHPEDFSIRLEMANCLEESGDVDGAEMASRDALRIEPGNARGLNFLGYLLADHNRRLEEAEQLILKALALDPDNGAYVDSLGWVYYRLGRLEDAKAQLERAVELTGGDAVVREHLGDVYRDLHLIGQARDQYRLSLAAGGSNPRLKAKIAGTSQ